ncbi:arabinofuranosidase catalytic domain-containing protein [Ancylobacter vacuolatus]|uniref:Alpha-L-arabinofuranosidase B catalytic domain-containing protein n=1 Tax=Ancylobacter vacuolatus TaxID=223389 RepID=A0ABU0DFH9_9HYPH|nr:arabinofuranosidase catalytic domain-containing protein [Ancylobacter vacuolatus]MDQ0347183.1 hypothetical protein [Ancylobacter vacuolatus]
MASFGFALDLTRRSAAHPAPAPFDALAGPLYAAFGLSRLLSAYAGPCVRARRASDGAESDIGFAAAGALDVAALLAFAGAGSAYATLWYDQSGNGRHAAQPTGAAQPRIVNAGGLDVGPNGRPQLVLSGAQYLDIQNSTGFSRNIAAATYAAVTRVTAASAQVILYNSIASTAGSLRAALLFSTATAPVMQTRTTDTGVTATQAGAAVMSGAWSRIIGRGRYAAGAVDICVNGTAATNSAMTPAQNTPDSDSAANIRIGAATFGGAYLTGGVSTFALAQAAADIAALDAALLQVMP